MFLTKKATSIVEVVIILLIVVSWVVWMYQIYGNSQKLSNSTTNKIQAIQMAKEGIEAIKNIRDTNSNLFASDTKNCWNVLNYNNSCVWNNTTANDISVWSYKIYKNNDNRWYLESKTSHAAKYKDSWYRNNFKVWLDSDWFFTQSWATTEIKPLFTREIIISYPNTWSSNDEKMEVLSIIMWKDLASNKPHKVEFKAILTNWKK